MIERIPSRMPAPSVSLLRAFSTIHGIPPSRRHALHLRRPQASSRRCYAVPTHRNTSQQTIPPTEPLPGVEEASQKPPPPPPPRRESLRWLRPLIWATAGLLIGTLNGKLVAVMIAPPPMPNAGSPEDLLLTEDIQSRASQMPIVRQLSSSPEWKSWDAYNGFDATRKERNFTAGVLDGARAIGAYQRIWWNERTGEVVSVIWVGGSVSGWPGVTHGGLLATVLDESLGRCAMLPRKSGVVTANLNINYRAPTPTNSYYVIKAWPIAEGSTDRKAYVAATLEEPNGRVCVEANGLFVVPKQIKLGGLSGSGIEGF